MLSIQDDLHNDLYVSIDSYKIIMSYIKVAAIARYMLVNTITIKPLSEIIPVGVCPL